MQDVLHDVKQEAPRRGDAIFYGLSKAAGVFVLLLTLGVGVFLAMTAIPALQANTVNFFTTSSWAPDAVPAAFGIAALAFGTIVTSLLALALAVPVGTGVALYVTQYAPPAIGKTVAFLVDLLAAVPSIVFGLWGLEFLMGHLETVAEWLNTYFGWIPLFANEQQIYTRSIFVAGVVLAVMIVPTIAAVTREVFVQTPNGHLEAALALGATRWETVRMVIFPYGRPGMISAAMLGLGRALGETIAVALLLSAVFEINWHITEPGGTTFAANIALKWNEAGSLGLSALVASGLVLFLITLVVNLVARLIVARRREFTGS